MRHIFFSLLLLISRTAFSQGGLYVPPNGDSIKVPVNVSGVLRTVYVVDLIKNKFDKTKAYTDSLTLRGLINSNTSNIPLKLNVSDTASLLHKNDSTQSYRITSLLPSASKADASFAWGNHSGLYPSIQRLIDTAAAIRLTGYTDARAVTANAGALALKVNISDTIGKWQFKEDQRLSTTNNVTFNSVTIASALTGSSLLTNISSAGTSRFAVRGDGAVLIPAGIYAGTSTASNDYFLAGRMQISSGVGAGTTFAKYIHNNGAVAFQIKSNSDITLQETAGGVGIGATTVNAKSAFEITSTTKGALLPRMTKAQRDAIATPPQGLIIFVTDNGGYLSWYNSGWQKVSSVAD